MIRKILFVIAVGMLVLVLTDCRRGGDPKPDPKDVQLEKLSAAWKCTEATKDDVTQSGYGNFTLSISGTRAATSFGYSCTGRPALSPWPSSGLFVFGNNVLTEIVRDSDVAVTYSLSSDGNVLELSFDYQDEGSAGRLTEVRGQWRFKFTR